MHGEQVLVPIAFFAMIAIVSVGIPYVRGMNRRMEKELSGPKVPDDVSARLERMEHAIDAIAVEVERISEGQRFTTKLLSEKDAHALPANVRSAE
jgi:hypothetical protein